MAYGTMGGDGQPQSQAAVFTRHVLYRQPLDQAIDARRAGCLAAPGRSSHTNLRMESRFDGNLIDRLLSAGHDVDVLSRRLFRHHGSRRGCYPLSKRYDGSSARPACGWWRCRRVINDASISALTL